MKYNAEFLAEQDQKNQMIFRQIFHAYESQDLTQAQLLKELSNFFSVDDINKLLLPEEQVEYDDILQFSGVNLNEEELHAKHELQGVDDRYTADQQYTDEFINTDKFFNFIGELSRSRKIQVDEDCMYYLVEALKRKLCDLIEKSSKAMRIRTDKDRINYQLDIYNDLKRQLWVLENKEQKEMEKLNLKKEDDKMKKMRKGLQEREDLIIRKRMSNTIALQALGRNTNWIGLEEEMEPETPFTSLYAPYDDKEEIKKDKSINMKDLLHVLEQDKRYNKSVFLLQYYFGLHKKQNK